MNPHRLRAYIYLIVVSIIWGVAGVVIKFSLDGFPPLIFLSYRFFISSLIALIFFIQVRPTFDRRVFWMFLLYAFLNSTVGLGLLFFGFDKTTAIDATLISMTAPLLTTLAGVFFLNERVTKIEKIGMGIAFLGTLITILEPILRMNDGTGGFIGNLLAFLSILVGVVVALLAKKIMRRGVRPDTAAHFSFLVGFLTITPITLLVYSPSEIFETFQNAALAHHLGVFYLAILSGTIAYILWMKAQKTIEVSEASIFTYLNPIFATPLAVIWLHEKITPFFILGAIVITVGVIIAEWKKKRYN